MLKGSSLSVTVRFELTTPRLTAECSDLLSYATLSDINILYLNG